MSTKIFLVLIFAFLSTATQAQFVDDMEYDPGEPLEAWWLNSGDGIDIVDSFAHSGTRCGLIDGSGSLDTVLDLGSKTTGEWGLSFFAYIPSSKGGYFTILGDIILANGDTLVGHFFFNEGGGDPGVGRVSSPVIGTVEFDYPEGAWFQIILNFDLTGGMAAATWDMYVYGEQVFPPGTPFTAWDGSVASQLGGIDFFSIDGNNEFYLDTFNFEPNPILSIGEVAQKYFYLYPNPSADLVHIKSSEPIESISIFSSEGKRIVELGAVEVIDISTLSTGLYFVQLNSASGSQFQKLIKK